MGVPEAPPDECILCGQGVELRSLGKGDDKRRGDDRFTRRQFGCELPIVQSAGKRYARLSRLKPHHPVARPGDRPTEERMAVA